MRLSYAKILSFISAKPFTARLRLRRFKLPEATSASREATSDKQEQTGSTLRGLDAQVRPVGSECLGSINASFLIREGSTERLA